MYENYLLDADAIANIINSEGSEREQFKKTRHSLQLTKWLIENKCDRLMEIAEFLREFFKI